MGFAPAEEPRLTILVALDEPEEGISGGVAAAPVFREIASESLAYLGVFPEGGREPARFERPPVLEASLEGAAGASTQAKSEEKVGVPDFGGKTMRAVLAVARQRDMELKLAGSGRAVSQSPGAGGSVPRSGVVSVVFR